MTDTTTNPADEFQPDEVEEVADDQQDDQVTDQADEDGEDAEDEGSQDEDQSDEFEEIERNGKRYKIPKELTPDLLRQEDYTRKTQALSAERKALEAEVQAFQGVTKEIEDTKFDLVATERRLADLEKLSSDDWKVIRQLDMRDGTTRYDDLQREFLTLPRKVQELKTTLDTKANEAVGKQQEILAKQVEEGQAVLKRDIPGWGPELGAKLVDFVKAEYGVTEEKHGAAFMDPALVKMAYAAMRAKQSSQKQQVAKKAESVTAVRPVQKVNGGGTPKTGLSDNLSPDEWVRRREKQLAAQGRTGH